MNYAEKRKYVRYPPEDDALVSLDFNLSHALDNFAPQYFAVPYEEGQKGCGVIMRKTQKLQIYSRCYLQIGKIPPLLSEIRWTRDLTETVIQVGFLFLE